MTKTVIIIFIVSLLIIFGGYYYMNNNVNNREPISDQPNFSPSVSVQTEQVSVKGVLVCLPHKNSGGEQTLECAFGLKSNEGKHYALSDPGWKFLINTPMNTQVTVDGILTRKDDTKYDSVGVIEIINLTK